MTSPKAGGPVERATRAELRRLKFSVQDRGAAALAVALARQIDGARGAAAAALAAKELRATLADLTAEAEKRPRGSGIDDLRAKRAERARAG